MTHDALNTILYPSRIPDCEHSLQVDATHSLYIEESGNPEGLPVLFVHGGPGGGTSPVQRRFFNPEDYRIILFDQRGCGKSRPHASLTNNTTAHLIEDMEKIRRHLNIDRWALFGGSWGSTLSLLYAESYPERVLALVLRGIFLCRDEDTHWFYQQGADRFFPDYWQDFIAPITPKKRGKIIDSYYDLLTTDNEIARMRAAEAWSIWEGRTSTLKADPDLVNHFGDPYHALAMARIECHYFKHQAFLEPNQILKHHAPLRSLPIHIVQGRYDMVCPVNQAFELAAVLPDAQLHLCDHAGHSAFELEMASQLVQIMDQLPDEIDWVNPSFD